MADGPQPDWDPRAEHVLRDQRAAYDELRERLGVAYSQWLQWSLFRHEDVTRVLLDPETFSNSVSQHVSVPNGMDPPEHTHYRRIVEPYFSSERIQAFEPVCRLAAAEIVQPAVARGNVEVMAEIGLPFAARVQCAFLGWPSELPDQLIHWTSRNFAATRSQDRPALAQLAAEFKAIVGGVLESRLKSDAAAKLDVTAALMREKVREQPLSKDELASILRNWTVGEVGTISAAVGIIVNFLAEHGEVTARLRSEPALLSTAIEEILRLQGPLVSNRRVARRPVEIGGRKIDAGATITLIWVAANRDGRVFEEPDRFRWDRDQSQNLLFGRGIHVCPAAPLARMVLRVFTEEFLKQASVIELTPAESPTNAQYPAGGFERLPVTLRGREQASTSA